MLLSLILLLPLLGALFAYTMRDSQGRWFTAVVALLELGLVGWAAAHGSAGLNVAWLPSWGINLQLKLTGLNVLMLALTPILVFCAALATSEKTERLSEYSGHLLLLLASLQGVFLANNLGLFYIFFELMLLPTLLLVSRWGGDRGQRAAVKFLLYTLAGSLPMLLAVVALAVQTPSPDLSFDALAHLAPEAQMGLFGLFFLAFAVKVPLFPLHGWVVDLYENSPAPVTAVVAGAMSKAGLYGLARICVGLLPEAARFYADNLIALALFSLLYGAVCALGAPKLRNILAFSSLSHLALMVIGILVYNGPGRDGALLQMFSHGVCTGGLFLIVASLERRGLSAELHRLGGLHHALPRLTALALVLTMASLGCPGLSSFPGELSLLLGLWAVNMNRAVLACGAVIAAAWYLLRFFQGAFLGPRAPGSDELSDLSGTEWFALSPLVILVVWAGLMPQQLLVWTRNLPWN